MKRRLVDQKKINIKETYLDISLQTQELLQITIHVAPFLTVLAANMYVALKSKSAKWKRKETTQMNFAHSWTDRTTLLL